MMTFKLSHFYDIINILSLYLQYLEMRFSRHVRKVITATFVVSVYLILPVTMFIPSLAFSQVTGMNIHHINIIVSFICVFYTMLGGIKAVVWTDFVQAGVMLASCFLVLICAIYKLGGVDVVVERANDAGRFEFFNFDVHPEARHTFFSTVFGYFIMWCSYLGLNQSCVQRIVSLPSIHHARRALWIFAIGFFIIMSINCAIGIVMYARYFDCDPVLAGVSIFFVLSFDKCFLHRCILFL